MPVPRDPNPDSTLALLREGYVFASNRCRALGSDAFETRLMLRRAVCMLGEEAARVFYEPGRLTRRGALPASTLRLLQDKGSVFVQDGRAHAWRKRMFMDLMTPASIARLEAEMDAAWRQALPRWEAADRVVLHQAVREVLCRAVCRWVGLPLAEPEVEARMREIGAMIDNAGIVGPPNWRASMLRLRTERWLRREVGRIRRDAADLPEDSPARVLALHRDQEGELLTARVAAVEILNLLRPTVAIARFITFTALALHDHPEARAGLAGADDAAQERFVQEVRRFYPFFPFVGGRVLVPFEWREHHFAEGAWVLLDLYGTNHDGRVWKDPDRFDPDRFRRWSGNAFDFIPQGGGDFLANHRCPGEWITIALMKRALCLLTEGMRYTVPEQDLQVDLARMPALPRSGFVIAEVRRAE